MSRHTFQVLNLGILSKLWGDGWTDLNASYVTDDVISLLSKPGVSTVTVKFVDGRRKFRVKSA